MTTGRYFALACFNLFAPVVMVVGTIYILQIEVTPDIAILVAATFAADRLVEYATKKLLKD